MTYTDELTEVRFAAFVCARGLVADGGACAQRKREFVEMLWPMLESALGARMQEMMEIQSLSTAPSKQGRGYASALVQVVNDLVSGILRRRGWVRHD